VAIYKPAASSDALLILKPVDKRVVALFKPFVALVKFL
jgi:hypothetical protein